MRAILLAAGVIALVMSPLAVAAGGKVMRMGERNGTASHETKIISRVAATNASTGGYTTRQSNLSNSGGGAIYGCRSGAGGTGSVPPMKPCIRVNNLASGLAFEFAARDSETAGTITVGSGGDKRRPFTTNATGVATGLNADRVDGKHAEDLVKEAVEATPKPRWFLLDEKGEIVEQSGGFKVISAYADENSGVYIDAGSTLAEHGLTATLADPTAAAVVAAARCGTPAFDCVPDGAKNVNSLVVVPRDNAGAVKPQRVYVSVTP